MSVFRNPNLYLIFAITQGGIVGVSLLIPALPAIREHFALTSAQVGMVISMYTLPGILFIFFVGVLSDKFGRKALLVPSLVIFSLAGGGIYWADDFFTVTLLRFVQGAGGGALPSLAVILIGDLFEEKDRLKVMGLNAGALSIGTAVFPFIGGLMAEQGWQVPFLTFWFGLPLAGVVWLYLDEAAPRSDHRGMKDYFSRASAYMFTRESLFVFSAGIVIFILLYGGVLTYLTLYMHDHFGMSLSLIGTFVALASVASGGIAPFASRISDATGKGNMLALGFLCSAGSFALVLAAPHKEWLLGSFLLFGASMGLSIPLLQERVTTLAPGEFRGFMVSLFGMQIRVGQTVGPPLMALPLAFNGMDAVFWTCIFIASGFCLFTFARGRRFL